MLTVLRRLRRLTPEKVFDRALGKAFQWRYGVPVPLTHYYSPLPDLRAVRRTLPRWYREGSYTGLDLDPPGQLALLERLAAYRAECAALPSFERVTAAGYGPGYGLVEAHLLHALLRHLRPRKLIEVGSGVSTYFALNALRLAAQEAGGPGQLVCIEPSPTPKLRALAAAQRLVLHEREVQDVPVATFQELAASDVLFIDSSHVAKIDSDVTYLYLDVLPNLRPGVVVHIHDIHFPYPTAPPDHPLFVHTQLWNEPAVVRAFLTYNRAFEVLQCQGYLRVKHPDALRAVVSAYDERHHHPSSLWLRKTA
jgi:predicted O-methyltransferase YrrM